MKKNKPSFKQLLAVGLVVLTSTLIPISPSYAYDLGKTHKDQSIECTSCHEDNKKAIIPNERCLSCHESYTEISKQTSDMHLNPHMSPHFLDVDCTSCHQGHKVIKNFCQDCHGPVARH
ncbi:cytochrome c3 family protein [Shewanella abyssi]|uniref:cytochrome c3 family protein n=1 Tax=Shewanella abyssi TaxID=311789 RepID=UPI003D1607C1